MHHEIVFASDAVRDFRGLSVRARSEIRDALETHLRREPARIAKSRIKRLRGLSRPQFRLRVGDRMVFYDVSYATVAVLAVIPKSRVDAWLKQSGELK